MSILNIKRYTTKASISFLRNIRLSKFKAWESVMFPHLFKALNQLYRKLLTPLGITYLWWCWFYGKKMRLPFQRLTIFRIIDLNPHFEKVRSNVNRTRSKEDERQVIITLKVKNLRNKLWIFLLIFWKLWHDDSTWFERSTNTTS